MPLLDDRHICASHGASDFTMPGARAHFPPDLELEPTHLDIDLSVDLEAQSADGTVTTTVVAKTSRSRELRLHAVDFREVSVVDPDDRALTWDYDGEQLRVTWAEPFQPEETRRVAVSYRVEKPSTGLYFSKPDEDYPDAPRYAATDHETERARYWLPSVDHPSVRPTLAFRLRTEAGLTVLANGELVSEAEAEDGTQVVQWKLEQPCPSYLTCFVVGELTRCDSGSFEGRPIAFFATTAHPPENLDRAFGRTGAMLKWITQKLGSPFPYPKYYQFALPKIGGAMENISLVSWDDRFVLDERLAQEWGWLVDQVNIHEMAHSYFGDWIVCRDFSHAWLKESWATYIETCWLEDTAGLDEAHHDFYANASAYFGEADDRYKRPIVTRVFNHSWDMYDHHLYPGGACRLHTLRKHIGDEVFWTAVRDYVSEYGGRVVETDDFRRVVERHSGRSLGQFFHQWFHSKGYPWLAVTFEFDDARKAGTFKFEQKQVDEKAGVPVFELDITLEWVLSDEVTQRRVVSIEQANHTVVLPMDAAPEMILIDPDGDVLHKLEFDPGDKRLRRQLGYGERVIPRIRAAHALAETGRVKNIEAIRDAYLTEPFWGARVQFARALGKSGSQRAAEALAELLGREQDPMVLGPLLDAVAAFRDKRVAEAIVSRLDEALPYRATASAYVALGKQRENAPVERLAAAAGEAGYGGHAQGGALRGLAASRHEDAPSAIIEQARVGADPYVRPVALLALGDLGGVLKPGPRERVVECLVDCLRDDDERVRLRAVQALAAIGATEALPALSAHRPTVCGQDRGAVDRAMARIQGGDKPKVAAFDKRLGALEEKLRSLDDLVRTLSARREIPEPE